MAIKRYWRLVGIATPANGDLELSELRLYESGAVADTGATLTATTPPSSGSLADLRDGSASGIVSWSQQKYSAPGFALVWDFGVGGGADRACVQMGSGASAAAFPSAATMQSSSDGVLWGAANFYVDFVYPGANVIGPPGVDTADIYSDDVVLLLPLTSPTLVSTAGGASASLTLSGSGASITSAQSKYGGSSLEISSNTGKIDVVTSRSVDLTGTFTVEAWVRTPARATTDFNCLITTNNNTYPDRYTIDYAAETDNTIVGRVVGAYNSPLYTSPSQPYVLGSWVHIAYVNNVADNTFKIFIGGAVAGSRTAVSLFNGDTFQIGRNGAVWGQPPCHTNDLRITTGVARYTTAFTPPGAFLAGSQNTITRAGHIHLPVTYAGSLLADGAATGHMREHNFFDAYNGGVGTIAGTVKEKNTPANTPLRRRVLLVDEASRITIRETWSDPVTGVFEFRGIKQGVKYSTISYDHLHNYRAVIADNQDAS